jgi:hypothetical protein
MKYVSVGIEASYISIIFFFSNASTSSCFNLLFKFAFYYVTFIMCKTYNQVDKKKSKSYNTIYHIGIMI